jgi:transposase
MDHDSFWLSEEQFARLGPLLPNDTRGVARVDDRRVISGIVHVLQSGCRWRDAPACYGPYKTLYNRFVRWARKGVWERIFRTLAECGVATALMLDATHIKAHRSAAGGKGGPKPKRSDARAAGAPPKSTSPSMNMADRGG